MLTCNKVAQKFTFQHFARADRLRQYGAGKMY